MRNNRSNNTRSGRSSSGENKFEKVYYIVIGILVLVLLGLILFIFFSDRGGNTSDISENPTPGSDLVEDTEEDPQEDEGTGEEDSAETDTDENEDPEEETDPETDEADEEETVEEDLQDEGDLDQEQDYEVDDNAPHDPSYTIDYGEGSSDRIAIAQAISQTTGLNQSDMIEWWVGNNGPGRVEATVSNSNHSEIYRVLLQYGDGSWHVTSVEELSELP